ncbi:MAG TPA: PAS domain S-box protein, partial [Anaerolineales bacterium]|nr:PAS domain S-box protein [Anaerolineales bacterium]
MHVLAEKEEVDMENVKMDFQLIFDQNPIPMWVHDRRTFTFLDVNQKFEKAFGYARDEILQMTLEDFFSAHQVPPLLLNLNQTPQPMPMLHLWGIRHKGGHVVNVEIACQPVAYQGGDAALVTAFLRNDQSLEKRTLEARLRISEFALSHSLDDILQKTLDEAELLTGSNIGFFHFMEADQKTLWLQNWSSNTLRNMCTAEGKYSHYPVEQAGIWADCARQRRPVMYNDYQSMGRAGTLPKGHAGLSRILTVPVMRGDAIVAIVGVGNKPASYDERDLMGVNLLADLAWDIAETKKAEDDLRKSEANYRTVMDQASDCIYIADLQGNYLDVNRAGCELLGYEREELLCLNIRDVIMAEPAQPLRLPELIIGKSVLSERRMKRKDGSFVLVEI